MLKLISHALSLPVCAHCKKLLDEFDVLCLECKSLIKTIVTCYIPVTSTLTMQVIALSDYSDPLKKLILAKNYSHPAASSQLAQLMLELTVIQSIACDVVVPVPSYWTRTWWRGFNHAQIMAEELARALQKPMRRLVRRSRYTVFQSELKAEGRKSNVHQAFSLEQDAECFRGKHILIVDDVMTTGATIQEIARVMSHIRPLSITAVVAARVIE